jgi:hypothetical protein
MAFIETYNQHLRAASCARCCSTRTAYCFAQSQWLNQKFRELLACIRGKHVRCFKGQQHPCFASCSLLVAAAAPIQLPAPAPQPGSPPREGGVSTPQRVVGGVSTADPSGSISGPGTAKPNPTPTDVSRALPGTTPTPAETAEGEPASSVRLSFPHVITIDA